MYCPNCGKKVADGTRFCGNCGSVLPEQVARGGAPEPTPAPAPVHSTAQPPATTPPVTSPTVQPPATTPPTARPPHAGTAMPAAHAAGGAAAATARKFPIAAIIAAACAVVALILAAVFLLPRIGGSDTDAGGMIQNETAAIEGVQPAVMDGSTEIRALARPTIVSLSTAEEASLTASVKPYEPGAGLSNVSNLDDVYLSDEQKSMLEENGFYVDASFGNYEFYEQYESNRYSMTPNFVTVDSMMHTYHLYFSHLMKNCEKNSLSGELKDVSEQMLARSLEQYKALKGTEWESAALRNVAFFAVGLSLLDPGAQVPSEVSAVVAQEVSRVNDASEMTPSSLFSTNSDNPVIEDYTQYKPRGYYDGDETLERYFRAMMWYGRANFTQKDEELDRSALLMTMAMTDDALTGWESIYTVTSFFAGASDDCGYYEYKPLIDAAYGADATVESLAGDEAAWKHYHELTAKMPAPKINSVVVYDEGEDADHEEQQKGYRFMGQRFTIDAAIMQNLVYNKVGLNGSGDKRMMPDALDVPAALGSDEALSILEERGATDYSGYTDNMQKLRDVYTADDPALWQASLYAQWLYTLNPLLEEKGEGYPTFMQSKEWTRKNLQSYLGSYTELKHDTVLYSKQIMVEMGGGVEDKDDRGYVEPEPMVYARLANLTEATSEGLARYGMLDPADAENLQNLQGLAEQLQAISMKELKEESLTDDEYELIRSYGGQLEHFWQEVYKDEATGTSFTGRDFPAAVVVDVATNPDSQTVLELGTGKVSRITVLVPVDGKLRVAVGSVFSFYQFEQPASDRLTDTEWREMMGIELPEGSNTYNDPAKSVEDWTRGFQYERN